MVAKAVARRVVARPAHDCRHLFAAAGRSYPCDSRGGSCRSPAATVLGRGGATSGDMTALDVVALGRLVPTGGILAVALPDGAGDARIARLMENEGDQVKTGDIVAELDNMPALLAARAAAESNLKAQKDSMEQVRSAMLANLAESQANHAVAEATLTLANQELERQTRLAASNSTTQVQIEQARANAAKARAELDRTAAFVERYSGAETGSRSDIVLAARNLDLACANEDLSSGRVVAPRPGSVLEVHARVGEKPSDSGVMTIGATNRPPRWTGMRDFWRYGCSRRLGILVACRR